MITERLFATGRDNQCGTRNISKNFTNGGRREGSEYKGIVIDFREAACPKLAYNFEAMFA